MLDRAVVIAGLAPVVRKRLLGLRDLTGRLLEEASHYPVSLAPCRTWQRLVGDVAEQAVLEGELLVALDSRDGLAADEIARLEGAQAR